MINVLKQFFVEGWCFEALVNLICFELALQARYLSHNDELKSWKRPFKMISFQYENVWQSYNLLASKQANIEPALKRISKSAGHLFVTLSTFFCGYSIHGISFRKKERKLSIVTLATHIRQSLTQSSTTKTFLYLGKKLGSRFRIRSD